MSLLHELMPHEAAAAKLLTMFDISNWQGTLEETKPLNSDILAMKASEGTGFRDAMFPQNWAAAKSHNKYRVAYHFAHPSQPAQAQVQFFLDSIRPHGLEVGDMLALDLEVTDGETPEAVAAWANDFCTAIKYETKAEPIVYTNENIPTNGNCRGLGNYPLWIASPGKPAGSPAIPKPWDVWAFHQYGTIRGVDADVCCLTPNVLDQIGVLPANEPTPAPGEDIFTISLHDGTTTVTRDVQEKDLHGYSLKAGTVTLEISHQTVK